MWRSYCLGQRTLKYPLAVCQMPEVSGCLPGTLQEDYLSSISGGEALKNSRDSEGIPLNLL